ncbi:protein MITOFERRINLIKE 1, chloroplastic-like [Pistacia vera]|uniref:protein MITOFERRINLIKE 1, chloroplastic-like n=1 Tax=Pistacia vera TaxID=55513 RepID=UPI001263D465|nr:protein MITOFERRINLIKE 1, chloroplastic-like [Pistacia vera]
MITATWMKMNKGRLENPHLSNTTFIEIVMNLTKMAQCMYQHGDGHEPEVLPCSLALCFAFTYVCLHPLDKFKTKLPTKGASHICMSMFNRFLQCLSAGQAQEVLELFKWILGLKQIEAGRWRKSIFSKLEMFPSMLVPPTTGAMENIVSLAIMVPKKLITQRMQAGANGRSWEVLLRILDKDRFLGLYYSATLLRNLPVGVLSYSSFEYLKVADLSRTKKGHLEPIQRVCCGALAGAIGLYMSTGISSLYHMVIKYMP